MDTRKAALDSFRSTLSKGSSQRAPVRNLEADIKHYLNTDPEFLFWILDRTGLLDKLRNQMEVRSKHESASLTRSDTDNRLSPDFSAVENRRLCDLSPAQKDDAMELWLRNQWEAFGTRESTAGHHLKFLLDRLTDTRAEAHRQLQCSDSQTSPDAFTPDSVIPDPQTEAGVANNLSTIARKKIAQMGGTAVGVVIRDDRGRIATVSDLGRVTWMDANKVIGPQADIANETDEFDLLQNHQDPDTGLSLS